MSDAPGALPSPDQIRARWAQLTRRLEAGGHQEVRVVAVTKGFPVEVVRAALDVGLHDIGESYAQELEAKARALGGDTTPAVPGEPRVRPTGGPRSQEVRWHAIGRLQRNKVRRLAPFVHLWQSVDRPALGAEIARWAPGAAVLVQVNISGEATKGGCAPQEAPRLVDALRTQGLEVRGLMGIGPLGPPEQARGPFRSLVQLAERLGLPERCLGMSGDLEVALDEGATMVRVGRALFGPRPT